jgi:hypothetical protein
MVFQNILSPIGNDGIHFGFLIKVIQAADVFHIRSCNFQSFKVSYFRLKPVFFYFVEGAFVLRLDKGQAHAVSFGECSA